MILYDSEIPIQIIAFIAQDEDRFNQMVALTGIGMDDIRDRGMLEDFQAMILDYALSDQTLILEFCAEHDLKPDSILSARRKLPGAEY